MDGKEKMDTNNKVYLWKCYENFVDTEAYSLLLATEDQIKELKASDDGYSKFTKIPISRKLINLLEKELPINENTLDFLEFMKNQKEE